MFKLVRAEKKPEVKITKNVDLKKIYFCLLFAKTTVVKL